MSINTNQNMEQAILKSATKLFSEKGFAATSTTEIAREAGCNQALVHYYFRTKERLFTAIFEKKIKFFIKSLFQIGDEDIPFEEKLAKKIETHFDIIKEDPKFPLFFFSELATNSKRREIFREVLGDMPQQIIAQFQEEIEREIENGSIRPISVLDLLMTIVSLNITGFIVEPVFKILTGLSDEEYLALLENRKKENVHIILKSLKP
jgi:TetR/AcrR family transcriptional regulator